LIGQTILTQVAQFPCIVVQHVGQFVKSFEWNVGGSEYANRCHSLLSEELIDSSFAQVVFDAPGQ
jgi:hypothetical protein